MMWAARRTGSVSFFFSKALRAVVLLLFFTASSGEAQKAPPSKPLDLNTATVEQLEQLPGVGPATAKAIVRFREKSGPFQRPEDLLAIHGISRARFEKIRPYVTVKRQ
jgi:competence protein ComEA